MRVERGGWTGLAGAADGTGVSDVTGQHRAHMLRSRGVAIAFAIGAGAAVLALLISACSACVWRPGPAADQVGHAPDGEDDRAPVIRVRIVRGASGAEIAGPARVAVRVETGDAEPVERRTPIRVTLAPSGWRVRDGAGRVWSVDPAHGAPGGGPPPLRIERDTRTMLTLDGVALPGALRLHARSSDDPAERAGSAARTFDVVEHVPIEQYLPGVLAKELIPGWSLEAFKAQAIAARSYALHERRRRTAIGGDFDVESTTRDQAYAGATEDDRAHRACRETRGLVLTWRGTILRAYYSSTTGGRAASARDTWPTGPGFEFNLAAPIQASPRDEDDRISPLFRWTVERRASDLVRRFRAFGRDRGHGLREISSLGAIRVASTNEFGRPTRYEIRDTGGRTWTLSAESLRLACNTDAPGLPEITREKRINSGDLVARVAGDRVVFEGRGFGHGVGMSQYGAEAKASKGWSAERILQHYYPGAQIERAY